MLQTEVSKMHGQLQRAASSRMCRPKLFAPNCLHRQLAVPTPCSCSSCNNTHLPGVLVLLQLARNGLHDVLLPLDALLAALNVLDVLPIRRSGRRRAGEPS